MENETNHFLIFPCSVTQRMVTRSLGIDPKQREPRWPLIVTMGVLLALLSLAWTLLERSLSVETWVTSGGRFYLYKVRPDTIPLVHFGRMPKEKMLSRTRNEQLAISPRIGWSRRDLKDPLREQNTCISPTFAAKKIVKQSFWLVNLKPERRVSCFIWED